LFARAGTDVDPSTPAVLLQSSSPHAYDYFGDSLLLHEDLLLVATPGVDAAMEDVGAITAFVLDGEPAEFGPFALPDDRSVVGFPEHMQISSAGLLVSATAAPYAQGDEVLDFAGRVYQLD
jgi:hypothetical protein